MNSRSSPWPAWIPGAWSALTGDFRRLAQALDGTDFKARLAADSRWVEGLADKTDQNSDLLEFLTRLPGYVNDPGVAAIAAKIRADVGYPADVDALSHEAVSLDPAQAARFELRIEADGLVPEAKALKEIKAQWLEANQDQFIPDTLRYAVVRVPGASGNDREFIVSGEVTRPLEFRPWLAGTQYYILTTEDASGVQTQVTRHARERLLRCRPIPADKLPRCRGPHPGSSLHPWDRDHAVPWDVG